MINACIVLYKCKLSESITYQSLSDRGISFFNKIYIYSNTKNSIDIDVIPDNIIIFENENNKYLEENYRFFLDACYASNIDYVCFFDQDSCIPESYFYEIESKIKNGIDFLALYPKIRSNDNYVSPCELVDFQPRNIIIKIGRIKQKFIGINSCCVLNIKAVDFRDILDSRFPLDYLDYVVSYKISECQGDIYLLDCDIEHDLSVASNNKINDIRAISILSSEKRFIRIYGTKKALLLLELKNIARLLYSILNKNYKYSAKSLWEIISK